MSLNGDFYERVRHDKLIVSDVKISGNLFIDTACLLLSGQDGSFSDSFSPSRKIQVHLLVVQSCEAKNLKAVLTPSVSVYAFWTHPTHLDFDVSVDADADMWCECYN